MVMISRQRNIERHPDSMQSQFKRTAESKDYLGNLLPFSGSIRKWKVMKKEQTSKLQKLTAEELSDFRVPI
jgi:hypothetical protein